MFIAWVKALPPGAFPNSRTEPFAGYQKKLTADGMSSKNAEALAARLQRRCIDNPEWAAVNLNRVYSQPGAEEAHREKPNAFLIETVKGLRPGKALDIAMGEGRNSIYLAQQGWNVTGVDISDVGVAHANEKARQLGVRIDARVQNLYAFDFGTSQWDLVCLLYFYITKEHERLYQQIATCLKPGGLVIVEDLAAPVMESLLDARAKWDSVGLKILRLEYFQGQRDWSVTKTTAVARLVLQKPA